MPDASPPVTPVALGLVCGSLALYGSFGIVTNATFSRSVVPLGATPVLSR